MSPIVYVILTVSFVLTGVYFESFPVIPIERPPVKQASNATVEKSKNRSLPIYFVENKGMLDSRVEYFASGSGYAFYLSRDGATYALQNQAPRSPDSGEDGVPLISPTGYALKIKFAGAASTGVSGRGPQAAKFNYFVGKDKQKWRSGARSYSQVALDGLYDGIDLVYKSDRQRIKYEFTVAPGADYRAIRLDYEGAESLALDDKGALLIDTPVGQVKDARPFIFQNIKGRRVRIEGGYAVNGRSVGFWVGGHKKDRPLIIDPGLSYSTFIGGGNLDYGVDLLSLDASGCAYVTGYTFSLNFPTTAGAFDTSASGGSDVYISKLNPSGSALIYSTFLGGVDNDYGQALTLDDDGSVYVVGNTLSADFPRTPGALDEVLGGAGDAFVSKLDASGSSLTYSTFLGGGGVDYARGLAVDAAGSAYVGGYTDSPDFPTTAGAFDTGHNGNFDAFVSKIDAAGQLLQYSTFIGGGGADYAYNLGLDSSGSVYLTGNTASPTWPTTAGVYDNTYNGQADIFATKLEPNGAALSYSTFLGGSSADYGSALFLDAANNAYLTGRTSSTDFPTTANAFDQTFNGEHDGVTAKVDALGSTLVYSSFLGGGGNDFANDISVDSSAAAYVTGYTYSGDFPATADAFDQNHNGMVDVFISKIDTLSGDLTYSSFFGGARNDFGYSLALDPARNVYLAGSSNSTDFPISPTAFDPASSGLDAFVAKMDLVAPTTTLETSPAAPNGDNGWFVSTPTVRLSTDESAAIFFQWDSTSGPWETYSAPTAAPNGDRRLYYYSADTAGNTETVRLQPLPVDTNDPTPPVLTALSTTMTAITLSWSEATDAASGIDRYRIQRATGGLVLGETSSTIFIDTGLTPDSSYSYYVTAVDLSGRWSAPSNITTGTTDSTPSPPAPATGTNLMSLAALALLATALGAAMLSSGRKRTADTTRKGC